MVGSLTATPSHVHRLCTWLRLVLSLTMCSRSKYQLRLFTIALSVKSSLHSTVTEASLLDVFRTRLSPSPRPVSSTTSTTTLSCQLTVKNPNGTWKILLLNHLSVSQKPDLSLQEIFSTVTAHALWRTLTTTVSTPSNQSVSTVTCAQSHGRSTRSLSTAPTPWKTVYYMMASSTTLQVIKHVRSSAKIQPSSLIRPTSLMSVTFQSVTVSTRPLRLSLRRRHCLDIAQSPSRMRRRSRKAINSQLSASRTSALCSLPKRRQADSS